MSGRVCRKLGTERVVSPGQTVSQDRDRLCSRPGADRVAGPGQTVSLLRELVRPKLHHVNCRARHLLLCSSLLMSGACETLAMSCSNHVYFCACVASPHSIKSLLFANLSHSPSSRKIRIQVC